MSYRDDPDVQLMLAYGQGDEGAFRMLFDRYKRSVYVWVFRMLGNSARAEEISQEVFLRVYRAKHRYEPKAKFRTWLYTIAARLAFNETRDARSQPKTEELTGEELS